MAIRYFPGASGINFETEVPQGPPTYSNPLQALAPNHKVITQVFMQRQAYYVRPAVNKRYDYNLDTGNIHFCEDSPREPVGVADLVTWTRTWADRPIYTFQGAGSLLDYDQIAVQMPARGAAFRFDIGTGGAPFNWYPYLAAKSYSLPRRATILRDFFLIGTTSVPDGIYCDYTTINSIPSNNETITTSRDVTTGGAGPLSDDQYFGIAAQNVGLFSGAVLDPGGSTSGTGNVTYTAGTLSSGDYWVGQSLLTRYLGNIWERRSTRITL